MTISRGKIVIMTEKTHIIPTSHDCMQITDKTLARKDIQYSMATVVEMVIVINFMGEAVPTNTEMITGTVIVMGALVIKRHITGITRAINTGTMIGAGTGKTVTVTHILGVTTIIHSKANTETTTRT